MNNLSKILPEVDLISYENEVIEYIKDQEDLLRDGATMQRTFLSELIFQS